jgi:hypothetical protein
MEATFSSETSVHFQLITWCYIPEDRSLSTLQINLAYNLASHDFFKICLNIILPSNPRWSIIIIIIAVSLKVGEWNPDEVTGFFN